MRRATPRLAAVPLTVVVLVTACATVPSGPSVMVLPGTGKTFEQFQADDGACRQWAAAQTGTTAQEAATRSTVSGAAIGTAVGAGVGAAIGAAAGGPATGAAIGAGAGLLGGTVVGAGDAYGAQHSVQRRYDIAYVQCMYAKGDQVPVPRGSMPSISTASTAPPAVPPPPGTPPAPPAGVTR
jgi:YmgG-like glycine-zipper protein